MLNADNNVLWSSLAFIILLVYVKKSMLIVDGPRDSIFPCLKRLGSQKVIEFIWIVYGRGKDFNHFLYFGIGNT